MGDFEITRALRLQCISEGFSALPQGPLNLATTVFRNGPPIRSESPRCVPKGTNGRQPTHQPFGAAVIFGFVCFSGPQLRPRRISCSSKCGPAAAKVRPSFDIWEGSCELRSPLGGLLRRCPCLHRLAACRPELGRGDNVHFVLPLSRPPPNRVRAVGLLWCERESKVGAGLLPRGHLLFKFAEHPPGVAHEHRNFFQLA